MFLLYKYTQHFEPIRNFALIWIEYQIIFLISCNF